MNNGHTRNKQTKEFNFDLNSIDDTLHFLIKQKNVKGRTNTIRKKLKFSLEKKQLRQVIQFMSLDQKNYIPQYWNLLK